MSSTTASQTSFFFVFKWCGKVGLIVHSFVNSIVPYYLALLIYILPYLKLNKIFSRRQTEIFSYFFPKPKKKKKKNKKKKMDLVFHANCLHFPLETICMKYQILFSGKIITTLSSA